MTTMDISTYDGAQALAEDLEDLLSEAAEVIGQDPDLEITLREENGDYVLYWDGGPWDWAVNLLGGENILGTQLTGITSRSPLYVEAKNGQSVIIGEY